MKMRVLNRLHLTLLWQRLSYQPEHSLKICGGGLDTAYLSDELYASLFYLEPEGMSVGLRCKILFVTLRCRLPPSQSLLDLLFRLKRAGVRIRYKGSEHEHSLAILYSDAAIEACQKLLPFGRRLMLTIDSMDTTLDVSLSTPNGHFRVSNTPYKVCKLLEDDGIGQRSIDLGEELGCLMNVLFKIVGSFAD